MTSVESITLMSTDTYVVVSVGHADGTIVAIEMKLAIPELPFLKLGDFEVRSFIFHDLLSFDSSNFNP